MRNPSKHYAVCLPTPVLGAVLARFAGLKADSSSAASQSAVVQALLAARASGDIPGVYGRLGDLGAIDAK
jgi:structural maintenance of chromosome 4